MRYGGHGRWPRVAVIVAAVLVVVVGGYALHRQSTSVADAGQTLGYAAPSSTGPTAPPQLHVSTGSRVTLVGDSWALGTGADRPEHGFIQLAAARLGWRLTDHAQGGAGYVAHSNGLDTLRGLVDHAPTSGVRLLVLEGGINDIAAASTDARAWAAAARATIRAAMARFPQVLIVGPCSNQPQVFPMLREIDYLLAEDAHTYRLNYVSCIERAWINSTNAVEMIHPAKTAGAFHPTTAGHAYLAGQMLPVLRADLAG